MIAQFLELKAAYEDCLLFYRMGDFYELFFDDAQVAARALGIMLTKRGKHLGADIPMCGVPVDRANDYLQKLIVLGYRVAVCEQTEDPSEAKKRGAKSVVRRDVVRLVTPGTITEEALLDPARANAFVALARLRTAQGRWRYGLASIDISTGEFFVQDCETEELLSALARLEPREIVAHEALCRDQKIADQLTALKIPVTPLARDIGPEAAQRMQNYFGVNTLEGFGALSSEVLTAAATALFYVERTQKGEKPVLQPPKVKNLSLSLEIDAATRANLELTRTLSGAREGSLLSVIDTSVTSAGARLMSERLAAPLTDPEQIIARLDAVSFFLDDTVSRNVCRDRLKRLPDLARAISRLSLNRGGPRDLKSIGVALTIANEIAERLSKLSLPNEIIHDLNIFTLADITLAQEILITLKEDVPLDKRSGDFIRDGSNALLDEARSLRDESRTVIASLQARYASETNIKIKIKHNNFLGFFIEAPAAQGEKLLQEPFSEIFTHRQTMADAMRFTTSALVDLQSKIASAADRALTCELEEFDRLANRILSQANVYQSLAQSFARLDVVMALAEGAERYGWSRPEIDNSLRFEITGGRHPVVEASLKQQGKIFAPNDCDLTDKSTGRIAVVTGPNMAGKSTFLRQNAIIALMAQAGSFASDDLARGRSTFMVEMVETATILNCATPRSLVILDEIGRGTATFDGLSIAWATIEHLHEVNCSRALFATHFHELTQLSKRLDRLTNLTMRVSEHEGNIVFLHEVISGAADRSYGVHVAQIAGLPSSVIARAYHILSELEAADRAKPVETLIDDLPLFKKLASEPMIKDQLREALLQIDPDQLTPREALAALYELKGKA
ncbi:MAG: DNA mismatch repair protein MutS [Methylocystaceae bacterium]|nr:DNA mismatch repair protein MutS [Methylocystaceae bacterium]